MKLILAAILAISIIPKPNSIIEKDGYFTLNDRTAVVVESESFQTVAEDFVNDIGLPTGFSAQIRKSGSKNAIILREDSSVAEEGYRLEVTPKKVVASASSPAGVFYALQTLRQLLPAEIYSDVKVCGQVQWNARCCVIEDAPRLSYRGMELDVCRYFYPKETVKKFIDMMAMHKQNYLQLHLTEDQAWRIEIKKYPRLTEIGAWRPETKGFEQTGDGIRHGGYYTQDDIREIVDYAAHRFVTIIPEIELPGHSSAAIAAYPYLSCTPDEPKEVNTQWGIKEDVFCPSPETFKFLEDVFDEVLELFPSPYYHIGGDECPRTAWRNSDYCRRLASELGLESVDDLQYYFVKHFDKYLRERGKTVIGWDEILDGSAVKSTVVMSYRGHNPAIKAMKNDMKVILCPNRFTYYDYHQSEIRDTKKNHHLFITLRKAYNYNPTSFIGDSLMAVKGANILGYQACLWGESIPESRRLEHQTFPREACIAEFCWTADAQRDFKDFCVRMLKEFKRLDACDIRYSDAFWDVIVNMSLETDYPREVELELDYPYAQIHYTTDGAIPTADSPIAPASITVNRGDVIRAQGFTSDGRPVGKLMTRKFENFEN